MSEDGNVYTEPSQVAFQLDILILLVPRKVDTPLSKVDFRMDSVDVYFITDESGESFDDDG
jgi:hypothetical protein